MVGGLNLKRNPFGRTGTRDETGSLAYAISSDPALIPSPLAMLEEGEADLEEWVSAGTEQAVILRAFARMGTDSSVVELGCGYGRLAFALRRYLIEGKYLGVDADESKIDFLGHIYADQLPNFEFAFLDARNSLYNPTGRFATRDAVLPVRSSATDVVASFGLFTHLMPNEQLRYLLEICRILQPGGRCVISFYCLDYYSPDARRPPRFGEPLFSFEHGLPDHSLADVRTCDPSVPETMLAISSRLLREMVDLAGLSIVDEILPGAWSGQFSSCLAGQDLVVLAARRPKGADLTTEILR